MPSDRRAAAAALAVAALVCALGNLWAATERTTIPLSLGFEVEGKVLLREKHPGDDDTCMLRLKDRAEMQVDREIYDAVEVGDVLSKSRFDRVLRTGRGGIPLAWSRDARGLIVVMPAAVLLAGLLAWRTGRRSASVADGAATVDRPA